MKDTAETVSAYMKIRRYVVNLISQADGKSVLLPSILELSKKFGVSGPTVSKAMKSLTSEGLVIGRRGLGSFTNPAVFFLPAGLHSPKDTGCRKNPIVGVLYGDGRIVHLGLFDGEILGCLLLECPWIPSLVHLISLTSSDENRIYEELNTEFLNALVCIQPTESVLRAVKRFAAKGLPVIVSNAEAGEELNTVSLDIFDENLQLGRQLAREGRKKIALLPANEEQNFMAKAIRQAYREAGLPLDESMFLPDFREGLSVLKKEIQNGNKPDAVIIKYLSGEEIRAFLLDCDPEIWKGCALAGFPRLAPDPEHPFHVIYTVPSYREYAKTVARRLSELLSKSGPALEHIKIKSYISINKENARQSIMECLTSRTVSSLMPLVYLR